MVTLTRRFTHWFSALGRWFRPPGGARSAPPGATPPRGARRFQPSISIAGPARRPTELSLQTLQASLRSGKITPAEYAARVARLSSGLPR